MRGDDEQSGHTSPVLNRDRNRHEPSYFSILLNRITEVLVLVPRVRHDRPHDHHDRGGTHRDRRKGGAAPLRR